MTWGDIDSNRWELARSLFGEALSLAPDARDAWLEGKAGHDAALLAEVRSLLHRVDEPTEVADVGEGTARSGAPAEGNDPQEANPPSAGRHPDPTALPPGMPERIAAYSVESVLGEGGMGWVFRARQQNPDRLVALKVIKAGLAGDDMRRRFERESKLLARLQHPVVAQVYEAGTTILGAGVEVPYFAMELVEDGVSITHYARSHQLSVEARLELFADVVDGIEHGHQRGVMHRDIKPMNVLVDGAGRPRIIDFGLCRATDEDRDALSLATATGQIMGTPHYMSPEQFDGDPKAITLRSDVYSLGVLMFQLLSFELPYDMADKSLVEMADTVKHEQPRRLGSTTHGSSGSMRSAADLDTIIAKAMDKDPERRYGSAAALAADVRRCLRGEPIEARPASALYQLRLFARRNKALVGGTLAVMLVSIVAAIVSLRFAFLADERADQLLGKTYSLQITAAARALEQGDHTSASASLDALPDGSGGWERRHLQSRLVLERAQRRGYSSDLRALTDVGQISKRTWMRDIATASQGTLAITASGWGDVRLWDVTTGDLTGEFRIPPESPVSNVRVSLTDAADLFSVTVKGGVTQPMDAWLVDSESLAVIAEFHSDAAPTTHGFEGAALSPDGSRFAWITPAWLELYERAGDDWLLTGRRRSTRMGNAVAAAAEVDDHPIEEVSPLEWLPDGSGLIVQESAPHLGVLLLDGHDLTEQRRWDLGPTPFETAAISGDGAWLALIGTTASALLVSLSEEDVPPRPLDGVGMPQQKAFIDLDFDGSRLLTGDTRGRVGLYDLRDLSTLGTMMRHGNSWVVPRFADNGRSVVTAGFDGMVRFFDAEFGSRPHVLRGHVSYVYSAEPTPSGERLVTGGWDGWPGQSGGARPGSLRFWDMESGEAIASWRGVDHWVKGLALLPDGERLAVSFEGGRMPGQSADGAVLILDLDTGRAVARLANCGGPLAVTGGAQAFLAMNHRGSEQVVDEMAPSRGHVTAVVDARTLEPVAVHPMADNPALSPSGELIALTRANRLSVRSTTADETRWERDFGPEVPPRPSALTAFFDPSGAWLVTTQMNEAVTIFEANDGQPVAQLDGFLGRAMGVAFAPDGSRMFVGDNGGVLHVFDTADWSRITALRGHESYIHDVHVTDDGERVITASGDGTVRYWDTVTDPDLLKAKREHRRLVTELEPLVLALLDDEGLQPKAAAGRLKTDPSLDEREREVALQLLLGESMARDPDPLGERLRR
jgi:serine/threonine protein kinase/WD40 repeat protein